MAILSDLAKETSFRRFYLRWLAACLVPLPIVAAIWSSGWVTKIFAIYSWLRLGCHLELPLLIGLGQWWFFRSYSERSGRWAVAVAVGGIAAVFIWAFTTTPWAGGTTNPLIFLGMYARSAIGWSYETKIAATVGGVLSGIALTFPQAIFLAASSRQRLLWLITGAVLGGLVHVLLLPLNGYLTELFRFVRLGGSGNFTVLVVAIVATLMPAYLMAYWALYSSVMGGLLWILSRREATRQLEMARSVFD